MCGIFSDIDWEWRECSARRLTSLHFILWRLFFAPFGDEQDAIPLLLTCVPAFRVGDKETCKFGTASEASPMVTALKYHAHNVFYGGLLGNEGETADSWDHVEKCTSPHSDKGVT